MKFTNKMEFPVYVRQWLEFDSYDREENTITATGLLRPIRMLLLEERHKDEIEIDLSDVIASRWGTALHDSFEKVGIKGSIQEQRFRTIIDDKIITGKVDMIIGDKLVDLKSTSVWTYIYASKLEDYRKQLSVYKLLAEMNGIKINSAEIMFLFTDWSKSKSKDKNYPSTRILIQPIQLWKNSETKIWISARLKLIDYYKNNNELPECSKEELWQSDTTFAVYKGTNTTATKICDTQEEAETLKKKLNGRIEERLGKVKRCEYCNVRPFCEQYKNLKKQGLIE